MKKNKKIQLNYNDAYICQIIYLYYSIIFFAIFLKYVSFESLKIFNHFFEKIGLFIYELYKSSFVSTFLYIPLDDFHF